MALEASANGALAERAAAQIAEDDERSVGRSVDAFDRLAAELARQLGGSSFDLKGRFDIDVVAERAVVLAKPCADTCNCSSATPALSVRAAGRSVASRRPSTASL